MALTPGTRLGVYEVTAPIGAGGMGQVYRAIDTKLKRQVAIKILPPSLAADHDRIARFQREAEVLASLNHPNIVAVFDIGQQDGVTYIVSELVDGETLRGASLPVRKVTGIGAQIADALAAAHGVGVTHRDIKPDNVMVTRQGRVKVLDFGVAKVSGPLAREGVTVDQTQVGSVVGTVGYMAPEQVRGDSVDHRTDIFAVGALLYELLAGAHPFKGETPAEIMTATLREDPEELPAGIPSGIRQIVGRCLEKNPGERFQSAQDLAFALQQLTGSSVAAAEPATVDTRKYLAWAWMVAVGFVAGGLVTAAAVVRWAAVQDATVDPIRLTRIAADRRNELSPRLSPDGRSLAYLRVGGIVTELLVKPLDGLTPITLTTSNTALVAPVWSSDGNQVCYTSVGRDLLCVGAAGGSPRRMLGDAFSPQMAPDGRSVFFVRAFNGGPRLFRSAPVGSEPERVGEALPSDLSMLSPVSPDGSAVIVSTESGRLLISLPDGARRALPLENGVRTRSIAWLPDSRHIVVAEETTTLIGSRLAIQDTRSAARRVVLHSANPIEAVTVSSDGARLVFSGGPVERDLVEYSGQGHFVRTIAASSMLEGFPSWARAGDRFVYRVGGPGQIDSLWLGARDSTSVALVQQLTSNHASQTPISPDGGRIAYVDPSGIQVVSASGGRAIRVLSSALVGDGLCWTPDGEWIWYSEGPTRLGRVPSRGGEPLIMQAAPGILLDCSADGRWLVRRGPQAFVLTATDGKGEREVASASAYLARSANSAQFGEHSKVLYLLGLDRRTIDVWDVESGRKRPTIVFDIPSEDQIEGFSISPDGTRVLLTTGGNRNDLWMVEGFARPSTSWGRWFGHWASPPTPASPR